MSTEAHEPNRLLFVDTLRGLAVIFMVQLHTSHGWLSEAVRGGDAWTAAQFFGGLAAPAFLMLAGVSLGVQWAHSAARGLPLHLHKHTARGLQLIVLGYALRLQMWVIDSGAYSRAKSYFPIVCLLAAYLLAHRAAGLYGKAAPHAARWAGAAAGAWILGMGTVRMYEPERLRGLLRVDVLQCIGASLVLLNAVAAGVARYARTDVQRRSPPPISLLLIVSALVGLATPWLRERMPGVLPDSLAGYLAQWPTTDGKPVVALFPLFPWAGFACVGAALGLHWARAHGRVDLDQRVIITVALGAWIALITSEASAPVFALTRAHDWLGPVLRLAYKCGLVMALAGVAIVITTLPAAVVAPVHTLGRASLLVYWAHLELAFGVAARPMLRRLDMQSWALGTLLLMCAMWLLAYARVQGGRGAWPWTRRPTATTS